MITYPLASIIQVKYDSNFHFSESLFIHRVLYNFVRNLKMFYKFTVIIETGRAANVFYKL